MRRNDEKERTEAGAKRGGSGDLRRRAERVAGEVGSDVVERSGT